VDIRWLALKFPELRNLQPLTSGGQKVVAAANHPTDGSVVLKIIRPDQSPEETEREILAVQQVASQRVPPIFAHGKIDSPMGECCWFRERRIAGETLRDALARGPLSLPMVKKLAVQILEALVSAESVQIVHRDVKPENIICDSFGDYWLIDFGIARHLNLSSLTASSSIFGKSTLGYAPREQMRNMKPDIDSRSDLFALGITLYECVTGSHPFLVPSPASSLEIIERVENTPLPSLSGTIADYNFCDLIASLTQKRRDHRPLSAFEALEWAKEL
jgi:serine/threonine protein kinase